MMPAENQIYNEDWKQAHAYVHTNPVTYTSKNVVPPDRAALAQIEPSWVVTLWNRDEKLIVIVTTVDIQRQELVGALPYDPSAVECPYKAGSRVRFKPEHIFRARTFQEHISEMCNVMQDLGVVVNENVKQMIASSWAQPVKILLKGKDLEGFDFVSKSVR